ncbi:hypothetical protein HDV02_004053 [Globomyces sp. JEL0801]|nr:hypothetical protein HDV02_004053 [Globomyces sp. JEL0801]
MMLWEKKIQLAKETQSALDPNVGATEIREMTLEIHRMTLRYASMLKLQEKMIAEMEKSVYRRESISTKSHAKGKGSSQASLQKAIIDLTKRIKQAVTDVKECEKDIVELEQSQDIIKEQLEESLKSQQQMEERYLGSELELEKYTARKQMDMNSNKYKYIQNSAELRVADMDRADVRIQKVKSMVEELQNQSEQHFKMFAEQLCVFIDTTTQELKGL